MGCHTWSYRALKNSEFEETKKRLLDAKMGLGSFAHQTCLDITEDEQADKICQKYAKVYGRDITKGEVLLWIKRDTECVEELKNCTTISDLAKIIKNYFSAAEYKIVGNKIYVECGFDEPVRIYGYHEVSFTDPFEFIKWIKDKEERECHTISEYCVYDISGNVKHVKGYTPEMEELIKNFWQKYDNDVYVEFG